MALVAVAELAALQQAVGDPLDDVIRLPTRNPRWVAGWIVDMLLQPAVCGVVVGGGVRAKRPELLPVVVMDPRATHLGLPNSRVRSSLRCWVHAACPSFQ
ncbi:MAG TPA: hypothetical protein VIF85_07200, partial [Gaiellaceae bacterium]